jgi:hypothetical protein
VESFARYQTLEQRSSSTAPGVWQVPFHSLKRYSYVVPGSAEEAPSVAGGDGGEGVPGERHHRLKGARLGPAQERLIVAKACSIGLKSGE